MLRVYEKVSVKTQRNKVCFFFELSFKAGIIDKLTLTKNIGMIFTVFPIRYQSFDPCKTVKKEAYYSYKLIVVEIDG